MASFSTLFNCTIILHVGMLKVKEKEKKAKAEKKKEAKKK